jgi:Family of unknown function (DUF6356)
LNQHFSSVFGYTVYQFKVGSGDLTLVKRLFTQHPETVGETYLQHMGQAFSFGIEMFVCSFACLLHGLFPFLFVKTGSNAIVRLNRRMVTHRDRRKSDECAPGPVLVE